MSTTIPSPSSVPAAPSAPAPNEQGANRRQHDRLDYRAAVVVIADEPGGFRCLRCRSNDLSVSGARLICQEPLTSRLVYLRILMPGLAERFVEAEIVNERVESELRIGFGIRQHHVYGVTFRRVIREPSLLERLRAAAGTFRAGAGG